MIENFDDERQKLEGRKREIHNKLDILSPKLTHSDTNGTVVVKEFHWDFLLKEMVLLLSIFRWNAVC